MHLETRGVPTSPHMSIRPDTEKNNLWEAHLRVEVCEGRQEGLQDRVNHVGLSKAAALGLHVLEHVASCRKLHDQIVRVCVLPGTIELHDVLVLQL